MKITKEYLATQFNNIKDMSQWKTTGLDVDYRVVSSHTEEIIYLYFKESDSKLDWVINLYFPKKVYKGQENYMLCHRGFVKAWKSANDVIMDELLTTIKNHPTYQVFICGWSLGGALSQLASEDYYYRAKQCLSTHNIPIMPTLITYGSPKVSWGKRTQKHFQNCCKAIYQIANYNDLVTYLPPFPHLKHIGLKKRIGDKFSIKKLFDPQTYHTNYGDIETYRNYIEY